MNIITINSWSTFKSTCITNKGIPLQYKETTSYYEIFAFESADVTWNISLFKDGGSDILDFENNYKTNANTKTFLRTAIYDPLSGNQAIVTNEGRVKTDGTGTVQPVSTTFQASNLDTFGRLRTSHPTTIFECAFIYDTQPLLWSNTTAGSATLTQDSNLVSVKLSTTTSSSSSVIMQTRRYMYYHPGKSQLLVITGNMNGSKTNCRRRLGSFDSNNGVFFELDGTTARVVIRSKISGSIVDTQINQSSWNLDKLDGTGSSGLTLDLSKQLIFLIDFQWLGSGMIRFGFNINGTTIYVHQQNNSNILTTPYSQYGTLPVRVENTNTGTTASTTDFYITCVSVISEGDGTSPTGVVRTINNGSTSKSFSESGSIKPVISIRKQTSYINIPIQLLDFATFANSVDDFLITLIINGTLSEASWSNVSGLCQKDVSATSISGGTEVYSFYLRGGTGGTSTDIASIFSNALTTFIGSDLAGNSEIFSVVAKNLTATASISAVINYKEYV